ncbi:MAG: hypothetical protein IKZ08_02575 [Bacteroidales bacterium]|nr:hypothetical protein [Bacteroidales bacterium]
MELTFAPRGHLQIDDARIIFRNFEGRGDQYNREGERNFAVIIPTQEMAGALADAGWNVTIRAPREPGEEPFMFLKVKVNYYDNFGPVAYLNSAGNVRKLDEESIGILDKIELARVDMDIRPHDWNYAGRSGRTARLDKIHVIQELDRFAARYAEGDPLPF